jgi:hypothetical protein
MPVRREDANATPCAIQPGPGRVCYEPAHVVLFAETPGTFAGQAYGMGERVLACLEHGGQIYDAIHGRPRAPWLANEPAGSLPRVSMAAHWRSETAGRPRQRTGRPGTGQPQRPRRTEPWR